MNKVNQVQVKVMEEILTLQGAESAEYIRTLAGYINAKADKLLRESKNDLAGFSKKQMLVMINIADDLFREKEKSARLMRELEQARYELEEFIEAFDGERRR